MAQVIAAKYRKPSNSGSSWRMVLCVGWLLVSLGLPVFAQPQATSPNTPENLAFEAARKAFQDGIYDRAEREFEMFVRAFPQSPRIAEAVLLQAQAALGQQRLAVAAGLLTSNSPIAGRWAEDFSYWLGETHLRSTNYQAAAETFASLIKQYTNSVRLLEASYGEALARFKLRQFDQVAVLLSRPDGAFQQAARLRPNDELVARAVLLSGEALLEQGQYAAAEQALRQLPAETTPEYRWRSQYLLCRIQLAARTLEPALASSTNLLSTAGATGQPGLIAESVAMKAGILEQLGRWAEAAEAYAQNLGETVPASRRHEARLKTVHLLLVQGKLPEALQKTEQFFAQPDAKPSDLAFLTLGELYLRQHLTTNQAGAATTATNYLALALAQFDKVITDFPQSQSFGKAQLNKGWVLWSEGKLRDAQNAFRLAAERLPWSVDQAVARFKLADTQFQLKDYTNALQNFRALLAELPSLPQANEMLAAHANYQVLQLSLELNDLTHASAAMERVLAAGDNPFSPRGLLLLGQHLNGAARTADGRGVLQRFVEKFGERSPLRPQVELALARGHVLERNWPAALTQYEDWLTRYPSNEWRSQAEFNYARVNYLAGRESNAFNLFTNFVARHPADELGAWAQYWVGDYFYRQKESSALLNAEEAYQRVFDSQKPAWSSLPLAFQARMMAGRAAFARQAYEQAESYFTNLVNITDPACPPELIAEALFALGDTYLHEAADPARAPAKFGLAQKAFAKIPQFEHQYPGSPLVPAAWGRIGDCWLQLATQDPQLYERAIEAYDKALKLPAAGVDVRSQAEVGLGVALERQAQLLPAAVAEPKWQTARDHYLNVLYGKSLREREQPSVFWQKEAGLAAARLAESRKQWEIAVNIYNRLLALAPPLRPSLEKRLERAQQQLRLEKN